MTAPNLAAAARASLAELFAEWIAELRADDPTLPLSDSMIAEHLAAQLLDLGARFMLTDMKERK